MAIAVKALRFDYQSLNGTTGLTDVKGDVYVGGVKKATGLLFTEYNSSGVYSLVLSSSVLTGYGIVAGGENFVSVIANSATLPLPAPLKIQAQVATADDIASLIGTPAGASLAADIAAVQTKLGAPAGASVSADILALTTSQSAITAQLTALTNAAQSGTGIAMALPGFLTGAQANTFVIPFTITNNDGVLVNSSTGVTIGVKNQAGVDRGAYLTGSSGSPATVLATNASTGQYSVTLVIPAGAPEDELIFSANYTVGGIATVKYYVSQLQQDIASSGYALQTTLLATQTTVNAINSAVTNATSGLVALQALLANGTYGLSALQGLLANNTYGLSALQQILVNGTYGLSALASNLATANTALTAVQASLVAIQGTGFATASNSLVAISAAIARLPLYGGRGV